MSQYLIYRNRPSDSFGNASQVAGVIVNGTDEADARVNATAAVKTGVPASGSTKIHASWAALQLSALDGPNTVFLVGDVVIPALGGNFRGQ